VSSADQFAPLLPETLRLGPAHLTVSNLGGAIAFYEQALGLQVHTATAIAQRSAPAPRTCSSSWG